MARHAIITAGNGRRCPVWGAEGERDLVLALGFETLRQKDYRKQNPWRGLYVRTPKG